MKKQVYQLLTLLTSMFLLLITPQTVQAKTKNVIHIPEDAPSIHAGLVAAKPGDTVLVSSGIYYEQNLNVPSGVVLSGSDSNATIIDGSGRTFNGLVIRDVNNVTVQNLTITNSFGINIQNSDSVKIDNLIIHNNQYEGIFINGIKNSEITNNQIFNNLFGIKVFGDNNSLLVEYNFIFNNSNYGITLHGDSSDIYIANNTIDHHYKGISAQFRTKAKVINNSITNNQVGIDSTSAPFTKVYFNNVWGNIYDYLVWGSVPDENNSIPDDSNVSFDPKYIDPDNNDYNIDCTSPLVNSGTKLNFLHLKHYQFNPDIGAFETKQCNNSIQDRI